MFDVVIIGAGVVGALIARELSRYQLHVCLADMAGDVCMGASRANSGIAHAGYDPEPGSLKALFNVRGAAMMPGICGELGVPYKQNGSLIVAFSNEEMAMAEKLLRRGRQNGVPDMRILGQDELRALEPGLSPEIIGGLYAPGGIVCPYKLAIAAAGNAMDNGTVLKTGFKVELLEQTNNGYSIASRQETINARYVINAAGVYADEIAKMAGDLSFNITPDKGEYLILDRECGGMVSHTVFRMPTARGKGILVTPTADGNLMLGPTSTHTADKADTATTADDMERVWETAAKSVPGIAKNKIITSFSGLRATPCGGDFIVNRPLERFINVAGIDSPGLTAAPAIAVHVAGMLLEAGLPLPLQKTYKPTRIRKTAPAGTYNKIVCRCEIVSEGQIIEAIRTNPPAHDVDAVKRRVRAGMGRCQGGFCLPRVAELLAQEHNNPLSAVTKSGGNSYLVEAADENG